MSASTVSVRTSSAEQTREFGFALGSHLRAGDVIVLQGDLGAGKTTFTQGVGRALGIHEPVTSPTFVVAREHRGEVADLVHVDAYRIHSLHEWDDLDIDLDRGVAVIEWGDRIADALPTDRLAIALESGEDAHTLVLSAGGARSEELVSAVSIST